MRGNTRTGTNEIGEEDRMLITILIVLAIIALLLFIFRGRFVG